MTLSALSIEKRFEHRSILRGASLELRAGEIVLLRGQNGSGKTTFARILATLMAFDAGELTLDGEPVARRLRAVRRTIGFVTHQPLLYQGMSPLENLEYFGALSGLGDARARAQRLLARFGIEEWGKTPVERFSRGMLQRVALIRALLPEPRVLILDEPYAGLDDEGSAALNTLLVAARDRGAATLIISHERERIPGITRECMLANGVIASAPTLVSGAGASR